MSAGRENQKSHTPDNQSDKSEELKAERLKNEELEIRLKLLEKVVAGSSKEDDGDGVDRTFAGERKTYHDLHELTIAKGRSNQGWKGNPIIVEHEHKHYFHSNDSDGRPQEWSGPQSGHIHRIKWENKDVKAIDEKTGEKVIRKKPQITYVGPPMQRISVKGKEYPYDKHEKLRLVPGGRGDRHTHDTVYMESKQVTVRRKNEKAQAAIAARVNEEAGFANTSKEFSDAGKRTS